MLDLTDAVEAGAQTFPGWCSLKLATSDGEGLIAAIARDAERQRLETNEECRKLTRKILAAAAPLIAAQALRDYAQYLADVAHNLADMMDDGDEDENNRIISALRARAEQVAAQGA